MKTENKILTQQAQDSLTGNWEIVVLGFALLGLINLVVRSIPFINLIVPILIAGPIALGLSRFSLNIARGEPLQIKQVFSGFNMFGTAVATYLLTALFIMLWALPLIISAIIAAFSYSQRFFIPGLTPMEAITKSFDTFGTTAGTHPLVMVFTMLLALLLLIPATIAALSYSQTFFILADNPKLTPMEAITKSKEITQGNKWKLFCMSLRFIGWTILSIFTFGIGFLWLIPYVFVSYAKLYDDIKNDHTTKEEPVMA